MPAGGLEELQGAQEVPPVARLGRGHPEGLEDSLPAPAGGSGDHPGGVEGLQPEEDPRPHLQERHAPPGRRQRLPASTSVSWTVCVVTCQSQCPVVKTSVCVSGSISSFCQLKEEHEKLAVLHCQPAAGPTDHLPSSNLEVLVQETSCDLPEDPKSVPTDREERGRSTADEAAHKNRSKRESRRMRELEQAQFSLELLKVRTTSVGGALQEDGGQPEDQRRLSPRGSPASHGSFELLSVEDMDTDAARPSAEQPAEEFGDSNHSEEKPPNHEEGPRATFYIPSDQSPVHQPKLDSPAKSAKERRESVSRRPVVVLISMQKESPVEDGELLAAQVLDGVPACESHTIPIAGLEVASAAEPPHPTRTGAREGAFGVGTSPSAHGSAAEGARSCSSEVQMVTKPKDAAATKERKASRPAQEAPSPVLDTKPPKAQKKSSAQTVIVNMVEKPSNTMFSPPRRKLPFSK